MRWFLCTAAAAVWAVIALICAALVIADVVANPDATTRPWVPTVGFAASFLIVAVHLRMAAQRGGTT